MVAFPIPINFWEGKVENEEVLDGGKSRTKSTSLTIDGLYSTKLVSPVH